VGTEEVPYVDLKAKVRARKLEAFMQER